MSREEQPAVVVGNEFVVMPRPKQAAEPVRPRISAWPVRQIEVTEPELSQPQQIVVEEPVLAAPLAPAALTGAAVVAQPHHLPLPAFPSLHLGEALHRHTLIIFALLFLVVGSSGTIVAGRYLSARIDTTAKPADLVTPKAPTVAGLNITVTGAQLPAELSKITSQKASLTVGSQTVAISPDTIRSWLTITPKHTEDIISIRPDTIANSLKGLANQYVKAPVNQVTVSHTDGAPSGVIVAGQNGTQLSDPNSLADQAKSAAKTVMNGYGLNFSAGTSVVPFQAVTPAAFPKLLEVNLTTKQLYAYQNGQIVQTFLVSAGKPSTPTPVGEFQIWAKFTSQTMIGPGYVQPNVPWVNYFDHSGDAVHGVYWRAASVFGSVNTSHGCVGIPVSAAEWVYNWAPIGTTVITYNQPISS